MLGGVSDDRAVHVLWTGGWDSSFRVISLMFESDVVVQPHYLVDEARRSTGREISAMNSMREALAGMGVRGSRLKPTQYVNALLYADDATSLRLWNEVNASGHVIGTQYQWLSAYARMNGLDGLELSVNLYGRIHTLIGLDAVFDESTGFRVKSTATSPAAELFRPFSFPLFGVTKAATRVAASESGYLEALKHAWFCFRPRRGKPCGSCGACRYAIDDGMTDLVPRRRLLAARMARGTDRLRSIGGRLSAKTGSVRGGKSH